MWQGFGGYVILGNQRRAAKTRIEMRETLGEKGKQKSRKSFSKKS